MNKYEKQIIAMFTLSKNTNDKYAHLIASVVKYEKEINYTTLFDNINKTSNMTENLKNWQIIRVSLEENLNPDRVSKEIRNYSHENIRLIDLDVSYLVNNTFNQSKDSILKYIFFGNDSNKNLYNRTVFIFKDISWSNIVLIFRICNIHISGGSNSKRHLISTNQINLIEFLLYLDNFNIDLTMINKSFKDEFVSKSLLDLEIHNIRNKPEINSPSMYQNNEVILNFLNNNNTLTNYLIPYFK